MAYHPNQVANWTRLLHRAQRSVAARGPGGPRVHLPRAHVELLEAIGAAVTGDGLTRMFGLARTGDLPSIDDWNDPATWKFAWPGSVSDWTIFGESAWGAQYAYLKSDVSGEGPIYRLSAHTMRAGVIARDLDEFVRAIFFMYETVPDDYAQAAREKFGTVGEGQHIMTSPPPLINDVAEPQFSLMPAAAHMVVQGDIFRQCESAVGRTVQRIEAYRDSDGRERVRIVFR